MNSSCVICDAEPSGCEHNGARYLEPVVYERAVADDGRKEGWQIPAGERERWDNPPRYAPAASMPEVVEEIQPLIVELEAWVDVAGPLEAQLRAAYASEPQRVSRLVRHVINASKDGRLRSPGGVLVTRLRENGL